MIFCQFSKLYFSNSIGHVFFSYIVPLPKLTSEGARVTVHSLQEPGTSQFNAVEAMKLVFLTGDIRLREDICSGDILVYDLSGSSLSHLAQLTLPLVRKFMICGQVRELHINSYLQIFLHVSCRCLFLLDR
jgi:hypothetical protein